jgi:hypothetical protein
MKTDKHSNETKKKRVKKEIVYLSLEQREESSTNHKRQNVFDKEKQKGRPSIFDICFFL